jgi:hypothetical protein
VLSAPAAFAASPRLVASPNSGLTDGRRVTLTLSGFPANGKASITQCTSRTQVSPGAGCPDGTEGAVAAVLNGRGFVTVTFAVRQTISGVWCTNQCLLEASFGQSIATTPIAFGSAQLPFTGAGQAGPVALVGLCAIGAGVGLVRLSRARPDCTL